MILEIDSESILISNYKEKQAIRRTQPILTMFIRIVNKIFVDDGILVANYPICPV